MSLIFLAIVACLFGIYRVLQIMYIIWKFPTIRMFYESSNFGMGLLGLQMGLSFFEALTSFMLCRSLIRYSGLTRACQWSEPADVQALFAALKPIWNRSSLLIAIVIVRVLSSSAYFVWQG